MRYVQRMFVGIRTSVYPALFAIFICAFAILFAFGTVAEEKPLKTIDDIKSAGFFNKGIKVGSAAPAFALSNVDGEEVSLSDLLENGPIILSFYRGHWSPFISDQLHDLAQVIPELEIKGLKLVGVSNQEPDFSTTKRSRDDLGFEILWDKGDRLAEKYGIIYNLPSAARAVYEEKGIETSMNFGGGFNIAPPVTLIINKEGKVAYVYKDVGYEGALPPDEILKIIKSFGR